MCHKLLFLVLVSVAVSLAQETAAATRLLGGHPGSCPPNNMPEFCPMAMLDSCSSDGQCARDQKCCLSGCFRQCVTVSIEAKPGICPTDLFDARWGCPSVARRPECSDDSSCPGDQKCCSKTCYGRICSTPVLPPPPPLSPPATQQQCSLCNRGNNECAPDETCCGCGTSGTCRKGPCMLRCAFGPCPTAAPLPTKQCNLCSLSNNVCDSDETCCGCGTIGTCRKGPCLLGCAVGPCLPVNRAEEGDPTLFATDPFVQSNSVQTSSDQTSSEIPSWAIGLVVVFVVVLFLLVAVQVQLYIAVRSSM